MLNLSSIHSIQRALFIRSALLAASNAEMHYPNYGTVLIRVFLSLFSCSGKNVINKSGFSNVPCETPACINLKMLTIIYNNYYKQREMFRIVKLNKHLAKIVVIRLILLHKQTLPNQMLLVGCVHNNISNNIITST